MDRTLVCSRCLAEVPESEAHILPAFNDHVGRCVTSFRCEACWPATLAATRARLASIAAPEELASAAEVFHGCNVFIHEYLRGDPPAIIQPLLLRLVDLLGAGTLRLRLPGATVSPEAAADQA